MNVYRLWSQAKTYLPGPAIALAREARYQAQQLHSKYRGMVERLAPKVIAPGVPAPPADLRSRVHGSANLKTFIATGKRVAADIDAIVQPHTFRNALDFGCGCGRVITYLRELRPSNYTGIDVDQEVVQWSQENMKFSRFVHGPQEPPLPFTEGQFDFIFTVSVFSHLDEPHCRMWAKELSRVIASGGILLITTIGKPYWPNVPELFSRGFAFSPARKTPWFAANKCDWYGTTCMSADYAASLFHGLRLVSHAERGINNHQDAILLQKG